MSLTKFDAVISLLDGVGSVACVDADDIATFHYQECSAPSSSDIDAEVIRLQAVYDAQEYARDRATEYPTIGDQLDMLWHAIDTGDWTAAKVKLTSFYTELKAVKDKYPKE